MKAVKITLAVIVLTVIAIAIIWGIMQVGDGREIQAPKNQFTKGIELKIDSLKNMSESSFCDSLNNEIKYYIEDDYTNNRLGSNKSENDQWKTNLSTQLYAAYTDKLIKQAFYVFKGSEWELKKLNFIRDEYQVLQKEGYLSGMLEKNSNPDKKLNEIKSIFAKYDEITNFINSCKTFSFSNYNDLYAEFPISTVANKITRSKEYLSNKLENDYAKNCERLETNLSKVDQILFNAHVKYLDNKINHWNGKYINCRSQKDYSDNLFTPLKNEIDKLDNEIYNGNTISNLEYSKLELKLKKESTAAYNYFN
jgi:hypothetical protein